MTCFVHSRGLKAPVPPFKISVTTQDRHHVLCSCTDSIGVIQSRLWPSCKPRPWRFKFQTRRGHLTYDDLLQICCGSVGAVWAPVIHSDLLGRSSIWERLWSTARWGGFTHLVFHPERFGKMSKHLTRYSDGSKPPSSHGQTPNLLLTGQHLQPDSSWYILIFHLERRCCLLYNAVGSRLIAWMEWNTYNGETIGGLAWFGSEWNRSIGPVAAVSKMIMLGRILWKDWNSADDGGLLLKGSGCSYPYLLIFWERFFWIRQIVASQNTGRPKMFVVPLQHANYFIQGRMGIMVRKAPQLVQRSLC